jgi:hypothetical protein
MPMSLKRASSFDAAMFEAFDSGAVKARCKQVDVLTPGRRQTNFGDCLAMPLSRGCPPRSI